MTDPDSLDEAGEYFDPFAQVYDARLADDDATDQWVGDDVDFYRDLAREAPGPALEVGVGTGRVYLELLADGLDVDGIDLSEAMLARLRETADERELDPDVWVADAAETDFEREYGLVYAPARAINHVWQLDDRVRLLENVRKTLAPGGRFACNTFVPGFDIVAEEYGSEREQEVVVNGTTYRVTDVTYLEDEVEQVTRIHRELYRDGELVAERDTPFALIPKREFELLFDLAGFDDWTAYGGFDGDPLTGADQEMVWVARR